MARPRSPDLHDMRRKTWTISDLARIVRTHPRSLSVLLQKAGIKPARSVTYGSGRSSTLYARPAYEFACRRRDELDARNLINDQKRQTALANLAKSGAYQKGQAALHNAITARYGDDNAQAAEPQPAPAPTADQATHDLRYPVAESGPSADQALRDLHYKVDLLQSQMISALALLNRLYEKDPMHALGFDDDTLPGRSRTNGATR